MAEEGFTLLELLVVCGLIGLMIAVTRPALRDAYLGDPLKSTARKIVGLVKGVRESALRHQQPFFLHINRQQGRIWYEREESAAENEADEKGEIRLPAGIRLAEISVAGKTSLPAEQLDVWVTRQGYMLETRIRLEDEDGRALVLGFFPFVDSVHFVDHAASGKH